MANKGIFLNTTRHHTRPRSPRGDLAKIRIWIIVWHQLICFTYKELRADFKLRNPKVIILCHYSITNTEENPLNKDIAIHHLATSDAANDRRPLPLTTSPFHA